VGYDNIDVEYAAKVGISVFNIPDYGTEEVADHAFALLLGCARKIVEVDKHVKAGGWDWAHTKPLYRLRNRTLGIIGFGRIGSALSVRAHAFGVRVQFYDPYVPSGMDKSLGVVRCESLDDLLASSDMISINASLTASAKHLISFNEFRKMKRGVILVNTARGGIVNSEAMLEALDNGRLAAAGLDVLENEPNIPDAVRTRPNVILTAHSAFYTEESFLEMRTKSAKLARDFMTGRPVRNQVNGCTAKRDYMQ
jgi:D-3-phosphoglycerate dehydrogenase/C-terminal binding protein